MKRLFPRLLTVAVTSMAVALLTVSGTTTATAQSLNVQNTYQDAVQLATIYANAQTDNYNLPSLKIAYWAILAKYGVTAANVAANPLLNGHTINDLQVAQAQAGQQQNLFAAEPPTSATAISGSWQGIAINALATFMADRFKEEAMHMAIDELFKKMTTQDQAILTALFPATFAEITKLYNNGNGNYYTADLLYLRQLVQNDLDNLPADLAKNPETIFPGLSTHHQLEDILVIVTTALSSAQHGQALPDIIHLLAQQTYKAPETGQVLQIADLISSAMRNPAKSADLWVSPASLSPTLLASNYQVRCFYALLYAQLTDDNAKLVIKPLATNLITLADQQKITNVLASVVTFITQANNTYNLAKSNNFQFKTADDAFAFVKSAIQSLQQLFGSTGIATYYTIDPQLSKIIDQTLDITQLFLDKNYGRAVPVLLADLTSYLPAGTGQQYTRDIAFITQLVSVQNAQDFGNMLDAYALPIGSSSIKRNSTFNVSLNGYVGFTGGSETAYSGKVSQTKTNIGLTAPIGISATIGGGFTTFVSVIDLGSIVSARLNNDTTSFSGLKLEQFFAPGIGLYYNFHSLPLTIGAHYSYIPDLRTITYNQGSVKITDNQASVTRINISVLIDIPLITLFNRTAK